jgi:hypothetical protein
MPRAKELKAYLKANRWKRKPMRAASFGATAIDVLLMTNPGVMRWKAHAGSHVVFLRTA